MIESYLRQSALDYLGLAARAGDAPAGSAVIMAEKTLPAAVNLRGDKENPAFAAAVLEALGLQLPLEPNSVAAGDGRALLWLGPDEWLALAHNAPPEAEAQLAAKLRAALGDLHAAVTEVGESLACIHLAGPRARDVIAKGCPLDLHPRAFGGVGHCAQSHLAKTGVLLHQVGPENNGAPAFDLYTRRSFSDYLWRWLEDAGREYGLVVVAP